MAKPKYLIDLTKSQHYDNYLKDYATKRGLSPTAAAKQLLIMKIDEEETKLPKIEIEPIAEEIKKEPKRNILGNLNKIQ